MVTAAGAVEPCAVPMDFVSDGPEVVQPPAPGTPSRSALPSSSARPPARDRPVARFGSPLLVGG